MCVLRSLLFTLSTSARRTLTPDPSPSGRGEIEMLASLAWAISFVILQFAISNVESAIPKLQSGSGLAGGSRLNCLSPRLRPGASASPRVFVRRAGISASHSAGLPSQTWVELLYYSLTLGCGALDLLCPGRSRRRLPS
jgi:hypothetical protein